MSIDNVTNLRPSQEPVVFLCSNLLDADFTSEKDILNDLSQRRRKPRIQHRKKKRIILPFFVMRHIRTVLRDMR